MFLMSSIWMARAACCAVVSIFIAPTILRAQWDANDSVTISAHSSEIEESMIGDGAGGSFMTWSKWTSGLGWRIFAQHSDANGNLLWHPTGVQVSSGSGYQPQLVLDGSGGVIVLWRSWGIHAMRLNSNGSFAWPSEVEIVSNDNYPTYAPAYTGDGLGGAIITWDGPDNFTSDRDFFDVRAQRLSGAGQLLWGVSPVLVCGAPQYQSGAQVVADGQGGAIFAWRHEGATAEADIFAQRVDASGNLLWSGGGVPVCQASGVQEHVSLQDDGSGGAIAVWKDARSTTGAVYAQRLDALGQTAWSTNGVLVGEVSGVNIDFNSTADGAGGTIVAWTGGSYSNDPRTAQRISGNGTLLWAPGGVVIVNEDRNRFTPLLAADGSGGAFFTWMDDRRVDCFDTYSQHLDSAGNLLWDAEGVVVAAIDKSRVPFGIAAVNTIDALVFWGIPGPILGLPKHPRSPRGFPLHQKVSSQTALVLSRVTSTGTGLVADCVSPVAAPPLEVAMAISNRPNPFNPRTVIEFVVPIEAHTRLVVYDLVGRVVRTLLNEWASAGPHQIVWDGRDDTGNQAPSGAYVARLSAGEYVASHRMLLLK